MGGGGANNPSSVLAVGAAPYARRTRDAECCFCLFLSPQGEIADSAEGRFLRGAYTELCVRFCSWAWCVQRGDFDLAEDRFLCGALAARRPGTLVGTLLQGRPAERRGCGCGVGTAVGNYTPLPSGIAESAAVSPAPPGTLRVFVVG